MMKILVVRYRFIGDMILTIPFLRNLRKNYPDAQIDMLVAPNSAEVIEECPYVNNFIYFDTTRKHKYENTKDKKLSFWHYVRLLRKAQYDKAYVLKRSFSSALLCYLSGIKTRIGFDTEHRGVLLTKKVKYDKYKHESECFLDVLKADNLTVYDNYLENWISEISQEKIKSLLQEIPSSTKKAVVNITATNEFKVWDKEKFIKIIEYLANEKGVQVIFIGAPRDKVIYDSLQYNTSLKIPPLNLCGKVNLQDSLAVIKESDLMLGNDSGNLHMAASVGTRVIGIYGPMPFEKWKALGEKNIYIKSNLACMPCSLKKKCSYNKACLTNITVDTVKQAVDKVFSITYTDNRS